MWEYEFMHNAFIASSIIATICGIISVFVVIRRTAFASHALSHTSLTGAAAASLVHLSPLSGELIVNILAASFMGLISPHIKKADLTIGVVLSFFLGLGVYFLFLFQNNYSGSVMSILFGNILVVSVIQIHELLFLGAIIVVVLLFILRSLLFASLDPTIALSQKIPLSKLNIIFFILLAITVSMACQIVGALLVFILLVIPGAIANDWCDGIYSSILLSVISANCATFFALVLAYKFDVPVSFCLSMLMTLFYSFRYVKYLKNLFLKG
jgi:zinc/manganese transport system permease protein